MFYADLLPDTFKQHNNFVVYSNTGNEKTDKIPLQAKDLFTPASSSEPETWSPYALALSVLDKSNIGGLGFELGTREEPSGLVCVDIDDCINNGHVCEVVKNGNVCLTVEDITEILDRFNSFTEISPSGTGLHIWIRAKKNFLRCYAKKNKINILECYAFEKYIRMTCNCLTDYNDNVEDRQEALDWLGTKYFGAGSTGADDPLSKQYDAATNSIDQNEIIKALDCINCSELSYSLWLYVGTFLKVHGLDCYVWDEWSRTDGARYQEKDCFGRWDGLGKSGGYVHNDNAFWTLAVHGGYELPVFRKHKKNPFIAAEYDILDDKQYDVSFLWPYSYDDIGQAKKFAEVYKKQIRYTKATGFISYNGLFWQEGEALAYGVLINYLDRQREAAKATLDSCKTKVEAIGAVTKPRKKEAESYSEEQKKTLEEYNQALGLYDCSRMYRNYGKMKNLLQTAKSFLYEDAAALDSDPFQLNTPDYTYGLDCFGSDAFANHHDPDDLITKMTAATPTEGGNAEKIWNDALKVFFCGDIELQNYVQMAIGSALVGRVHEERMIIAYGDGRNGKSTFFNAIYRVLGTYSGKVSAGILTTGSKTDAKRDMAELRGKRFIVASELAEHTRLDTSVIKQLCSTDEIHAEKKFKDPFDFRPSHTLVLYTNHLPKVSASDDGTWRRLIVVPFTAKLTGESDIKDFTTYLVDNAGGAIMAWLVNGAVMAIRNGFSLPIPEAVRKACEEYRESNDWIRSFIAECCQTGEAYSIRSGLLYESYKSYCSRNGEFCHRNIEFTQELERLGYIKKRAAAGVTFYGIGLLGYNFA